jgi:hypothetical protein
VAVFIWLSQSQTVVIAGAVTVHVPSPPTHCSQPFTQLAGAVCALHAVSAARLGWQYLLVVTLQVPDH